MRVRDGFARNYLLPRGLVLIANKKNLKGFEHQKRVIAEQRERVVKQAQNLGEKLAAISLIMPVKTAFPLPYQAEHLPFALAFPFGYLNPDLVGYFL